MADDFAIVFLALHIGVGPVYPFVELVAYLQTFLFRRRKAPDHIAYAMAGNATLRLNPINSLSLYKLNALLNG